MCEVIGLIATTALSFYAQRQSARGEQAVAEYNARQTEQEGVAAERRGMVEAARHRSRVGRALSEQRTAALASGLELSGSAMDVLEAEAGAGETDAQMLEHNARLARFGAQSQAESYRFGGRMARRAGRYNGYASVLNGLTRAGVAAYGNTSSNRAWWK